MSPAIRPEAGPCWDVGCAKTTCSDPRVAGIRRSGNGFLDGQNAPTGMFANDVGLSFAHSLFATFGVRNVAFGLRVRKAETGWPNRNPRAS